MDFISRKQSGALICDHDTQINKAEFINKVKEGMYVKESYTVPRKGKSWAQCKLVFGNMIANAVKQANKKHITTEKMMKFLLEDAQRNEPNGVPVDKDFLHSFMYIISPTFNDDGEPITLSKMDTAQASRLFEVTRRFLARMEIIINDPPIKEDGNE